MSENNERKRKRGRKALNDDTRWTDTEMIDFVGALQQYGSKDTKNIALAVKTKSESAVEFLITRELAKARAKLFKGTGMRRQDAHTVRPSEGKAEEWPAGRKWQKIAQNQMMQCLRNIEYSGLFGPQIWERFCNEERSPEDPQCVDIRSIYGFLAGCIRGDCPPPELPPKESAIILMLLRLMKEMSQEMNTDEEVSFIKNFRKATKFAPFRVKDEFRKKGSEEEAMLPQEGFVPIPEEMYLALNRHKKVVQSLNPLQVPLWLLQKEHIFMARMFEDNTPDNNIIKM